MIKRSLRKTVDVFFDADLQKVWWDDPRDPCASMKYPASVTIFVTLVENFRKEGMPVLVHAWEKTQELGPIVIRTKADYNPSQKVGVHV